KLRSQIDGGKINPLLAGDIASNHASNKGASPGNRARIRNKLFDDSINEAISKGSNKAKMPDLANIKGSAMGGSSSSKA
ncbi:hypothetical protein, partial [Pseudomonas syringae]|uniref:hypothetical protein n=1 Tax=Pseudomonas syringae TaxID=317 RepID=UPI0034D97812